MTEKLFFIAIMVFMSACLQSQDKVATPEIDNSVVVSAETSRAAVIAYAKKYLGTIYKAAGNTPETGFDCSGFVYFVFKKFKIELPRGSGAYKYLGTALKPEEFKVGDILVFYGYLDRKQIGHVGIICEANGMKSKFIHSSSGRAYGVTISELGSEMYTSRFYKCIDVIH